MIKTLLVILLTLSSLFLIGQTVDGYSRSGYVEVYGSYDGSCGIWDINNISGTTVKFLRVEVDKNEYLNITLKRKGVTTYNDFQIMFKDKTKDYFIYICLDSWGGMVALMFNNDWFKLLFNFREGCTEEDDGNWRDYYEGIFLKINN